MKRKRFTEKIIRVLKEAEVGGPVSEMRKGYHGTEGAAFILSHTDRLRRASPRLREFGRCGNVRRLRSPCVRNDL